VIRREWGKHWIVMTTNGTNLWSFVTQIYRNCIGQCKSKYNID
jgi:hypothetical protein